MQNTVFLLVIFFPVVCISQTIQLDTLQANKRIYSIDSLEHNRQTLKTVIIRKYMHNETTVNLKYLFDTVTYQLHKCQYVIKTDNPNDSIVETTCFYLDSTGFVAVLLSIYRNGIKLNSELAYLDTKERHLEIFFQRENNKISKEEINSRSMDLWSNWTSVKDWLRKKNGG